MLHSNYRVAVVKWADSDAIAKAIHDELIQLGHQPTIFKFDQPVPEGVDVVFSFAPYGRLMQIPHQLAKIPQEKRPLFLHWNTENYPDPKLPWSIIRPIAAFRSWVDRLNDSDANWAKTLINRPPFSMIDNRMVRFRLIGEYQYAYQNGSLDLLFESSRLYTEERNQHGVPAIFVPWGTVPQWHEDLQIERDIDVLWMGKRRTQRRSDLLDQIYEKLTANGYHVYIADNEMKPFVYGDQRTEMLNRAKITLNIESEAYDNALPYRYHVVAPNRSLVVSEALLPHYPAEPGKHYVSAPYDQVVDTLLYYLENEDERLKIVEAAYKLVSTDLTIGNAIQQVMGHVDTVLQGRKTAVSA
jgi:hypothetical protein